MTVAQSMWKCEVFIPRTRQWSVLDETTEATTRTAYRRAVQKAFPILAHRQWRIRPSSRRPAKILFTITVEL
jgi:hypothetical protein